MATQQLQSLFSDPVQVREALEDNFEGFISRVQGLLNPEDPTPHTSSQTSMGATVPITREGFSREGKSEKHPDPPIFSGNPTKWKEFKTQLRVKLMINGDRYPTNQSRLAYTISRLAGNPLYLITPKINNGYISFNDEDELLEYLDTAYRDPNEQMKAQQQLRTLRQGNREFFAYWADFQRIIEDTGINENEARKSALLGGISNELRGLLIHHDIPDRFEDLAALLQRLDSKFRHNASIRERGFGTTIYTPPQRKVFNYTPSRPSTTVGLDRGDPMDLSSVRKVSNTEKERRRSTGACFNCGKQGHIGRDCPQKTPHRPYNPSRVQSIHQTAKYTGRTKQPTQERIQYKNSESKNE